MQCCGIRRSYFDGGWRILVLFMRLSPPCPRPARLNGNSATSEKHRWRNIKSSAQFLDVGFVEITFLMQDFGYDTFRAKDRGQIFLTKIIGIRQRAKDFDRRSIRNGIMFLFVCFDQGHQDLGVLLFLSRGVFLLASLSKTDRCCSCWRSDVIGIGELTSSAYFSGTPIIIFAIPSRRNPRDSECFGCKPFSTRT